MFIKDQTYNWYFNMKILTALQKGALVGFIPKTFQQTLPLLVVQITSLTRTFKVLPL